MAPVWRRYRSVSESRPAGTPVGLVPSTAAAHSVRSTISTPVGAMAGAAALPLSLSLQGTPLLATPSSTSSSYIVMRTPSENYPDTFDVEDHDCWTAASSSLTERHTKELRCFKRNPKIHRVSNIYWTVLWMCHVEWASECAYILRDVCQDEIPYRYRQCIGYIDI
jgi:hypothetical protein